MRDSGKHGRYRDSLRLREKTMMAELLNANGSHKTILSELVNLVMDIVGC